MPSHLADLGTDRLSIPNHPHLWVEFKREPTYHDELRVEQIRNEILAKAQRDDDGAPKLDSALIADFVVAKAAVMATDWNLADKSGATLPISVDSILKLRPDIIRFLGDEAARRMAGRPEAKEAPFVKPSRRTSRRASA